MITCYRFTVFILFIFLINRHYGMMRFLIVNLLLPSLY